MATGWNPRESADNQSEIKEVTKEINDVEAQVRKAEAAVEQATQDRNAVRATLREIAKKMTQLDLTEQERAALVAEQQLCVADLTAAEKDLEWLRKEKEQLRRKKEQLRKKEEQLRKKEEQLREEKLLQDAVAAGLGVGSAPGAGSLLAAAGAAAGVGTTRAGYAGADMATMRQATRDEALAVLEAQTAPRKPKSFSSVGNTEAFQFLGDLNLVQVVGNAVFEEELQLPDGTPTCIGFDMSGYANEDAATGPLLAHHKKQLELLGVRFGRAAFNIYDVHSLTNESLLIQHGNKAFRGIFDGCIAPNGLLLTSSLRQCRIVYEHKMPGALYARKGQAILKLLAACAYGPCPVLLDLTDGMKHAVYTIRGLELIAWTELTPTQAYNLQARHLMSDRCRTARGLTLEQIPEEEQAWMRPLHQLRPESGLREQLESVIPFLPPDERMPAALELIHTWAQAQQPAPPMQLPASIQAFYA